MTGIRYSSALSKALYKISPNLERKLLDALHNLLCRAVSSHLGIRSVQIFVKIFEFGLRNISSFDVVHSERYDSVMSQPNEHLCLSVPFFYFLYGLIIHLTLGVALFDFSTNSQLYLLGLLLCLVSSVIISVRNIILTPLKSALRFYDSRKRPEKPLVYRSELIPTFALLTAPG